MTRQQKKRRTIVCIFALAALLISLFLVSITYAEEEKTPAKKVISSAISSTYIMAIEPSFTSYVVPPIPSPSPIMTPAPRYGFTEDEIYLLAQMLCGSKDTDGDGEYDIDFAKEINYYEVSKVLCVVMNRVRSDKFPNNVYDVLMQKGQFSVMPENSYKTPSDIAIQTVKEWCKAYERYDEGAQVCPEDHLFFNGDGITNTTY